jgi:hypoxia up-regulated 1
MEDIHKERGPVPPLYTLEDLKESEDAYASISAWLEEKLAAQEKLGATDDPVLLVKDLTEKRDRLDKAGMELAMKGVRNFEKRKGAGTDEKKKDSGGKKKAKASSSSSSAGKGGKAKEGAAGTKTASSGKPAQQTIKLQPGEDGKMPSEQELEELLREFMKEGENKGEQQGGEKKAEEQQQKPEEKKEGHDEL